MANLQKILTGDFDLILNSVHSAIMNGSLSATLEESADFKEYGARCAVRVYERYSWFGGNRLSMSVTLFEAGGRIHIIAATTGGSKAMFFKVNTVGERAFLDTVTKTIENFSYTGHYR